MLFNGDQNCSSDKMTSINNNDNNCRNKIAHVEFISYCDMGFSALSVLFSTIMFTNSLPVSREGHEFEHDVTTVTFMGSVFLHFIQLFQAVRLLNSTENHNYQNDPEESIRLARSWQNSSLFFLLLLLVKFYIVHKCYGRTFSFMFFALFIGFEICYRLHCRYSVKEFIYDIEINFPTDNRYYSPYLWTQ